ncbi:membrane fusion protein (multidrug efflux system) [Pseudoduganella lurida]|uniref:Membrane fusion protein (Multidrug efflux system) n=1 Tax=Pseudoduganella lurida TaxID=1036180 RepID=A0A562R0J2_9BURK|nr:efflux RND transporter periplasmic adaptor subunit [Pseudoduganella lurida]TWI62094.1 membrane fusion protein (multidrug efflux system) [Pseudoduganella lurida]
MRLALFPAVCAAAAAATLSGCGRKEAAPPPPPPPTVSVITVAAAAVAVTDELPGRVEAYRVAQVRARTPGIVLKRVFEEGSDVKAGQVLFRIDPAEFQANVASAEAAIQRAQANLTLAQIRERRYKPLLAAQAVSQQEYDDAVAAQQQSAADLATARAARRTAGLTLGYATVTAPIAGRVGRALVTEGALVGQGEATPMALVQQLDPIYVTVTQSSTELQQLRQALASGRLKSAGKDGARVTVVLESGEAYPQAGKLLFADASVDESTGTVSLRAELPNPGRTLLPGMYVRARLERGIDEKAITVPQQAIVRGAEGASVMIVGADNKVVAQPVQAEAASGNRWIVSSGLKGGERIIVEGFQKAKPGAPVKPQPWQPPPSSARPAGA